MTDEQAKQYEKDCENCGNLDFPIVAEILTPLCKICKNSDFKYGTLDDPICSVKGAIPKELLYCHTYECSDFIHNKKSLFNKVFKKELLPNKQDD